MPSARPPPLWHSRPFFEGAQPPQPMALKSTIYKAQVALADIDRGVYAEHALTLALHPSETAERLMMRLLAFALCTPADDRRGTLAFAKGLSDPDEPDLWQRDLDGRLVQWIEVGQPDEKRLRQAATRAERAVFFAYAASTPIWWEGVRNRLTRQDNLAVWQVEAAHSEALAALAQRGMKLQCTVQDGHVWVADAATSVEIVPRRLR